MDLKYSVYDFPYASRRNLVYGRKGMVATTSPLAAEAGLDIMKKGGNAIDAAIATAACMTVLEPTSNGIGGDAFALVWHDGKLKGLNSSGHAPKAIDAEKLRNKFGGKMPQRGWEPVTVPGAVAGWAALSEKYGKLSFEELLAPAIDYAERGYPVGPTTAKLWNSAYKTFKETLRGECFEAWFDTFAPNGRAPAAGEMVYLKNHAETLREIAQTKGRAFYGDSLADKIDEFSKKTGGYIRKSDLESFKPEWVDPISTEYRGFTVSEIPPNGQGIVALMALNIFENYKKIDLKTAYAPDAEFYHHEIEAMKLAFADAQKYVTDPKFMNVSPSELLSKDYAKSRFAQISEKALMPNWGDPHSGGTIYLATADEDGNMVSFIQSNYQGFGSGIVVPKTGIALHNRGLNFSLDKDSDNVIAPGKRPYHTIIPGFLSKGKKAIGPFGVMGAFMQPQGHVQVVVNSVDLCMNPQAVLDAPRWQWVGEKRIEVEEEFPAEIVRELRQMGHDIVVVPERTKMGRGQIIWRTEDGVLVGATEPRADGHVAVW